MTDDYAKRLADQRRLEQEEREERDRLDREWVPDEVLDRINNERDLVGDVEKPADMARRMLHDAAPAAAAALLHLTLHGSNERVRLDAGKYVLDRVLGRPGDDIGVGVVNPLDLMVQTMQAAAEKFANDKREQ